MSLVSSSSVNSISVSSEFDQRGYVCPLTVMSTDTARDYHLQLEQAERDFGSQAEFAKMLRRYPNLVLPFVDEITRLPAITDVVAEILGPNLLVLDAPFFIKDAQSKSFVSWHQDLHYWGLESDEEVTAWVALTPATQESGCMRFVPESHRQRVEHEDTYEQDNLLTRGQAVAVEVDESQAVDAELQSGQMSIHHGRVFHASHPNRSNNAELFSQFGTSLLELPKSRVATWPQCSFAAKMTTGISVRAEALLASCCPMTLHTGVRLRVPEIPSCWRKTEAKSCGKNELQYQKRSGFRQIFSRFGEVGGTPAQYS